MFTENSDLKKLSINRFAGFTILEVLIVTALIGLLTSIALPSYKNYIVRSKLPDATGGLTEYRHMLEQYYQDYRDYGPASGDCGDTNDNSAVDSGEPVLPLSDYFTFSCSVTADTQGYTITATSNANQGLGAANAYAFTLDQDNTQKTTAFTGASGLPLNCWISKENSSC